MASKKAVRKGKRQLGAVASRVLGQGIFAMPAVRSSNLTMIVVKDGAQTAGRFVQMHDLLHLVAASMFLQGVKAAGKSAPQSKRIADAAADVEIAFKDVVTQAGFKVRGARIRTATDGVFMLNVDDATHGVTLTRTPAPKATKTRNKKKGGK